MDSHGGRFIFGSAVSASCWSDSQQQLGPFCQHHTRARANQHAPPTSLRAPAVLVVLQYCPKGSLEKALKLGKMKRPDGQPDMVSCAAPCWHVAHAMMRMLHEPLQGVWSFWVGHSTGPHCRLGSRTHAQPHKHTGTRLNNNSNLPLRST